MSIRNAFQSFPEIRTKNLFLRQIYQTDSNEVFTILGDEKVTEFYDDDTFVEITQATEQIKAWMDRYKDRTCIRWGITRKDE